jgi:two-component system sensor histidine kinase TtrS
MLRDGRGRPQYAIVMIDDITDRRRAEEDARQRQEELAHVLRVTTLNQMASGLAHEINQPLAAIVSYAKGCVHWLQSGRGVAAELIATQQEIAAEALRAGEVIRRLRQFVRKEPPRREWLDLNDLVRGAVRLVQADAREHGIAVRLDMSVGLPPVHVDRVQIEQVILNLVRNGLEAMEGGDAEHRELLVRTSMAGDEALEVAVCDSGVGLSADLVESVFNPFFTTKPNGLGMGLSISRLIIESHGGRLWATPEINRGTTFHFKLPGHCTGASHGD